MNEEMGRELIRKGKGELIQIVHDQNKTIQELKDALRFERKKISAFHALQNSESILFFFSEVIQGFPIKKSSTLRLVLAEPDIYGQRVAEGTGPHSDLYSYLDAQIADLLGGKNILEIPDTSKVHQLIFKQGDPFPRSIYAMPVLKGEEKIGFIWIADSQTDGYSSEAIQRFRKLLNEFVLVLGDLIAFLSMDQHKAIFSTALNALNEAIVLCDEKGTLLTFNTAAAGLFHLDEGTDVFNSYFLDLKNASNSSDGKNNIKVNDQVFEAAENIVSIPNREGLILYRFINITRENARNKYFSAVVNSISTSLQENVEAIIGYARLIMGLGDLTPKQSDYLDTILKKNNSILKKLENVFSVNRITQDRFLSLSDVDLKEILNTVLKEFAPIVQQKQLEIKASLPEEDLILITDKALFEQLMLHLLESATQDARLNSDINIILERGESEIQLKVEDFGRGMSAPDIEDVLSIHATMAENSHLCIAWSISELLLGNFSIKSQLGEGKTVSITFPES